MSTTKKKRKIESLSWYGWCVLKNTRLWWAWGKKKPHTSFFFFLLLIVWSASFALSCCGLFRCYCSLFDRVHDCLLFFFSLRNLLPLFFFFPLFPSELQSCRGTTCFFSYIPLPLASLPPFSSSPPLLFHPFYFSWLSCFFFFSFSHHMWHIALKTRPNRLLPSTSKGPFHISSRYTHLSDSIIIIFFFFFLSSSTRTALSFYYYKRHFSFPFIFSLFTRSNETSSKVT